MTRRPRRRSPTDSLIIDHRHTDLADVPLEWIEAAKSDLHIAYGHTSHGSQIITGMTGLTRFANAPHGGSTYAWNNGGTGGALDLADTPFSGADDLGNPNFTAWATATRSYLDDPANADVNVVMWSWCGQVSSASAANITTYLTLMSGLEEDYPDVRFVYMTGHTDGSGLTGNLHVRNQQIRDYCAANDKILYDFEDIESYDPDGTYFGDRNVTDSCAYDGGNWAIEWQDSHTKGVDWYDCDSAHSQPLNANLKAYAAWWLWARLAGWEGLHRHTDAGDSRLLSHVCSRGEHRDGDRHQPDGSDGGEVQRHGGKLRCDLGDADHRHRPGRRPERQDRRHDAGRNGS